MVKKVWFTSVSVLFGAILALSLIYLALPVHANRYASPSYTIDASTMNTFGGSSASGSYKLTSSGGEAVIGNGTGGSYRMGQGYVAQLEGEQSPQEASIELAVQPQGLVAYYPLDEGSGTAVYDSSSNENNGTIEGSPTWGTGKIGSDLVFSQTNTDQRVVVPDNASISPTHEFTVSAWVFLPDTNVTSNKYNGIVVKDVMSGVSNAPYELSFVNHDIQFATNTTADLHQRISTPSFLNSNTWYHAVGTYSVADGSQKLYLNGALVAENDTITDPVVDTTGALHLGAQKSGYDHYLKGSLDEVKIYNRPLDADEVKAEYDAQNAGRRAGLALGTVTPGTSRSVQYDAITKASTSNYSLAMSQGAALTNGAVPVPSVSGTITDPVTWTEGSTKGLGFTLVSGSSISGIWGTGNDYAALPGSATTFYTRSGYTPGTKDVLGLRLRLDVPPEQAPGAYSGVMTITGTATP